MNLEPIPFPGIDAIKNDFEFYKTKFINESVICFRDAHLSEEDHFELHNTLGELFGWHKSYEQKKEGWEHSKYIENHGHNEHITKAGPNEVMLSWHIEHTHYSNPIIAATWNMYNFKTDTECGKTYFVDTSLIYESFSDSEKDLLRSTKVRHADYNHDINSTVEHVYSPVQPHWITGKPVIRIPFRQNFNNENKWFHIDSINDKEPSEAEKEQFFSLAEKVSKEVFNNTDIRIVHRWKQGDLVMPDMFKLAHAVTGGFDPKDREFRGIWGWQFPHSSADFLIS